MGIDEGIEMPSHMLKIHPDLIDDKELLAAVGDAGVPLATARLYLEKTSPVLTDEGSRNTYLDQCIEDLFLYCEDKIQGKMGTIDRVKEKITKLEELAEMESMVMDDEEDAEPMEMYDDDGKPIKMKIAKKKMCESMLKNGKCKYTAKTCKYAHNPIELELVSSIKKVQNLQNVVRCLDKTMRHNKQISDWNPPSYGGIEDRKYYLKFGGHLPSVVLTRVL